MTQRGDVIAQTKTFFPHRLSISTNEVICLADSATGVYQSTDGGVTWSHVFNIADGWQCVQVIKVSIDSSTQVFWSIERLSANFNKWRLQVYTVEQQRLGNDVKWRDVTLPSHVTVDLWDSKLSYDGHTSMFVTKLIDRAVHVWSVGGQYVCQLVSSQQLVNNTRSVAVGSRGGHAMMYVGQGKWHD
jgi:hypothetical protein